MSRMKDLWKRTGRARAGVQVPFAVFNATQAPPAPTLSPSSQLMVPSIQRTVSPDLTQEKQWAQTEMKRRQQENAGIARDIKERAERAKQAERTQTRSERPQR